jgi:hypothetical protein
MLGWVAFGCQKHAFSLQKVDKNGAKVDHSVGNQMHRFWLGKMLAQPEAIDLSFVQADGEVCQLWMTARTVKKCVATFGCAVRAGRSEPGPRRHDPPPTRQRGDGGAARAG